VKRIWLWVFLGIGILAVIGGGTLFMLKTFAGKPEQQKVAVEKPSADQVDRNKLLLIAHTRMAAKAGDVSFTKMQKTDQGWLLQIDACGKLGSMQEVLKAAQLLLGEVSRTGVDIAQVRTSLHSSALRDDFGRQLKDLLVAKMTFSKERFKKVRWDDILPTNIPKVADEFWMHQRLIIEDEEKSAKSQKESSTSGKGQ
jgi:hypothetical protein